MKVNMSGGAVIAGAGVLVALVAFFYLKKKLPDIAEKLNPASSNNVVNKSIDQNFGEQESANFFDKSFAAVDLINPFNESDTYARQVWGLDHSIYPLGWFIESVDSGINSGALNPTSSNNVVNKAVDKIAGEENAANFFDKTFAAVDLLNPFNDSDEYARKVWGLQ